ncbi:MAG: glycosyltransferase [Clostridia bacterium]|nr:glycosyltransferase [Clostridia bacterium]
MSKIIYIGHYGNKKHSRNTSPAGVTLMDYISNSINSLGYDLTIYSPAQSEDGSKIDKTVVKLNEKTTAIFMKCFKRYSRKNIPMRFIQKFRRERCMEKELEALIENGDTVIVYHSLALMNALTKLRKRKSFKFILQVAEIYADVLEDEKLRKKEIDFIKTADKYILSTDLLEKELNIINKEYIVCSGTYKVEETTNKPKDDGKIHVVYAGTLDPTKGAYSAVEASRHLSEKYHVHILGFGNDQQKSQLFELIEKTKKETNCTITYDGCLQGESFRSFLQGCHVGLSTQNPNGAYNGTSFPSKILVYLANGLRVVSVKIPAIEKSPVGQAMFYYEVATPEEIAKAILKVDLSQPYDSRALIDGLNTDLISSIDKLLKE